MKVFHSLLNIYKALVDFGGSQMGRITLTEGAKDTEVG
jgi:hypothetical protein